MTSRSKVTRLGAGARWRVKRAPAGVLGAKRVGVAEGDAALQVIRLQLEQPGDVNAPAVPILARRETAHDPFALTRFLRARLVRCDERPDRTIDRELHGVRRAVEQRLEPGSSPRAHKTIGIFSGWERDDLRVQAGLHENVDRFGGGGLPGEIGIVANEDGFGIFSKLGRLART